MIADFIQFFKFCFFSTNLYGERQIFPLAIQVLCKTKHLTLRIFIGVRPSYFRFELPRPLQLSNEFKIGDDVAAESLYLHKGIQC